jgi:hypothetical protein
MKWLAQYVTVGRKALVSNFVCEYYFLPRGYHPCCVSWFLHPTGSLSSVRLGLAISLTCFDLREYKSITAGVTVTGK